MQSKIYGVKSNAARAAKPYGLTRADLIAVSGGWCFNVPSETAPQSPVEPATEAVALPETAAEPVTPASEPVVQDDEPLEWAGTRTDEIANHDKAGRDPYPHLQGRTGVRDELRNRLDEIEPSADCALRIIISDYPELTEEDIRACLAYAADRERRLVTAAK
jgi:hypothetical protein